jgi:hypothetical protein
MDLRAASWPILFACAAVACASAKDGFAAHESAHRAVMADRYPQGLPWSAPRDALGVFATWMPTEPACASSPTRRCGHLRPSTCCVRMPSNVPPEPVIAAATLTGSAAKPLGR